MKLIDLIMAEYVDETAGCVAEDIIELSCPSSFHKKLMKYDKCDGKGPTECEECWNQEIKE